MTRAEQETVINFDEESELASVYTFNGKLKRKLEKFAADFPTLCKLVRVYDYGAVEYEVNKSRLSINFKRPLSEEASAKLRERAISSNSIAKAHAKRNLS